jgi:adenylate cyclase
VGETRKLAAILVSDVVGYSRLAGADEDRILARLRTLRSDLIDPIISVHHGRVVKRTGDGAIVEFRSVVDAVNFAIEVQRAMVERNAEVAPDKRIEFRIGIHLGDVVEESDGDLMGDGVNIAARLQGVAKPGGICISDDAFRQVKSRLDLKVSDLGPVPLKNIAEPMRAYLLEVGAPREARSPPLADQAKSAPKRRSFLTLLAAAIAAVVLLTAAGGWYILGGRIVKPAQAAHLSIVVLPFKNLSGDSAQDYFADGITDNLTTDLSRIRNSFVIARNTAFTFKDKNVDAKEIGRELGVRYVLEGSVQRDGTRVRVNTQLIDAETGAHLWAERFEEDVADLFKLQDQVVARLSNSLGYELVKTEADKSARSKSSDAVDLAMRGWALVWREQQQARTKENNSAAQALFEQALKIDPNETDALAGDALTYFLEYTRGWTTTGTDYEIKILGQANRAIALAPDNVWAYNVKSLYLTYSQRANEGLTAADTGLAINPDDPPLYRARGTALLVLGRYEQAISDVQHAMQLSPLDPVIGLWLVTLGDAELGLGHFDAAIDEYHKAIDAGWRAYQPYRGLGAAYALDGKMDEAKSALTEARRLNPELTLKWLQTHSQSIPALLEGLREAGLPEDAPAEPTHLSLVVLPFTNLSGDLTQDYFADGITDNLTTDLSRIRNSFVIARNTAFTFKDKNVDAKGIGRELGVRYVLEGSAQRDQNRVRVNAQLIDAESGAHLWADRFEEDVADLFKLQDQVVGRLANSLGSELVKAEAEKGVHSKNPDVIDLAMRGWALHWQNESKPIKDKNDETLALFEQALKIDPNDADALAGEAECYQFEYLYWTNPRTDYDAKVIGQADRAIALAPDNIRAYLVKSIYLSISRRFDEALRTADAGLAINPNYAPLYMVRASSIWCELAGIMQRRDVSASVGGAFW